MCPAHGVYACRAAVELDGAWQWWPAATNVGVRPTFVTGRGLLVEAYLIGFDGDLYGRELRLAFLERLRGELPSTRSRRWSSRWSETSSETRRIAA